MKGLLQAVSYGTTAVFALLAVVAILGRRHQRSEPARWAALTFGTLALVTLVSLVAPENPGGVGGTVLQKGSLLLIVLFPFCLYKFTGSFGESTPPRLDRLAVGLTVAIGSASIALPTFPGEGDPLPTWMSAYLVLFLAQWTILSVIATVRLWRAGAGQPGLARRRMRTMALAAAGLNAAILLAVATLATATPAVELTVQGLSLLSALGFLVGLSPPGWVRVAWRREEQEELREAIGGLMGASTVEEVTDVLLPRVMALVGAEAAAVTHADGSVLDSYGNGRSADAVGTREEVSLKDPYGSLIVWTSPYTPYFGREEIGLFQGLGALADLALERAGLFGGQQKQRDALERANRELQEVNATLAEQAALLDLASDAIMVLDMTGRVRFWNEGARKLYGWSREEAVGRIARELLQASFPDTGNFEHVLDDLERRGRWEGELNHVRRDGSDLVVASRWALRRNSEGQADGWLEINTDITARKAAEKSMLSARREAERANQAKSEFLSRMSHELRTPLNAILGFGQLLELDDLTDEQRDGVEHILKAGRHLLELVIEVLDISRIESDRLSFSVEPVPLAQTIRDAAELVGPLANDKDIKLDVDVDRSAHVLADAQRLKQVLLNVLSNAIKYNHPGGAVTVATADVNGGAVRAIVRDTGRGIPEDKFDDLFTPFERLGAENSSVEGTGLGLALSKRLIEAMGGAMGAESSFGEGSTFWLQLPRVEVPRGTLTGSQPQPATSTADGDGNQTVLYIEDNLSNLQLVERILGRRPKVRLLTAMQGGLGVELARQHSPDLVFLDLHLPDISGEEALRRLQADARTRGTRIVIVSADATERRIKRLLESGASDYLTKPLDVTKFFEVLDAAFD